MEKYFIQKLYDIDGYDVINFFASGHLKDTKIKFIYCFFFFLLESYIFFDKLIDTDSCYSL